MTFTRRATRALLRSAMLLLPALVLSSCWWFPAHLEPDVYDGTNNVFFQDLDDIDPDRTLVYTVDVGSTPRDLYFVFTNPTFSVLDAPTVESRSVVQRATTDDTPRSLRAPRSLGPNDVILRDAPHLKDWEPPELRPAGSRSLTPAEPNFALVPPPSMYAIEYDEYNGSIAGTHEFYVDECDSCKVNAVLAFRRTVGTKTLEIWVQETEFDENGLEGGVKPEWTEALADAFLLDGTDNDIYDWVSTVYGEEWSDLTGTYSNIIGDDDTITILLWDIDNFGSSDDDPGGVVGFFWSKDNFIREDGTDSAHSNERVMFYLDSESFETVLSGEGTWSIDDYWPSEIVSTLGHELQHMILFHERNVLRGVATPTWMNELMSLVAEDLIEEKRQETGPRGVDPGDYPTGGAGPPNNPRGRLPDYNPYSDRNITSFAGQSAPIEQILASYGSSYAFGAYLVRNYGGAELMRHMMDVGSSDSNTVLADPIEQTTGMPGMTLEELLWRWGAAELLSDSTTPVVPFRLNTGGWMTSSYGGIDYKLGSINHFLYSEPLYVFAGDLSNVSLQPSSKLLYRFATDVTGTVELELQVSAGMDFAVVLK
ncbi:MAG: M30 family zinc metallopeptidase [Spirochaetota bacterium]